MSFPNRNLGEDWRARRSSPHGAAIRGRGRAHTGVSSNAGSNAGSTQSIPAGRNVGGLRDSDKVHPPARYKPGCILSAPFHSQDVDIGHKENEVVNHRTESAHGPIHSKFRKLVVVKNYFKHCVVVPMYSYEGSGLKHKSDYIQEYVSIRDPNQANASSIVPDTHHGIIWTDGTNRKSPDDRRFYATNPTSVLHITQLSSHDYMMKCTLHGHLMPESTERLIGLFEEATRKEKRYVIIGEGVSGNEGGNAGGRGWLEGANFPGMGIPNAPHFGSPSV